MPAGPTVGRILPGDQPATAAAARLAARRHVAARAAREAGGGVRVRDPAPPASGLSVDGRPLRRARLRRAQRALRAELPTRPMRRATTAARQATSFSEVSSGCARPLRARARDAHPTSSSRSRLPPPRKRRRLTPILTMGRRGGATRLLRGGLRAGGGCWGRRRVPAARGCTKIRSGRFPSVGPMRRLARCVGRSVRAQTGEQEAGPTKQPTRVQQKCSPARRRPLRAARPPPPAARSARPPLAALLGPANHEFAHLLAGGAPPRALRRWAVAAARAGALNPSPFFAPPLMGVGRRDGTTPDPRWE